MDVSKLLHTYHPHSNKICLYLSMFNCPSPSTCSFKWCCSNEILQWFSSDIFMIVKFTLKHPVSFPCTVAKYKWTALNCQSWSDARVQLCFPSIFLHLSKSGEKPLFPRVIAARKEPAAFRDGWIPPTVISAVSKGMSDSNCKSNILKRKTKMG